MLNHVETTTFISAELKIQVVILTRAFIRDVLLNPYRGPAGVVNCTQHQGILLGGMSIKTQLQSKMTASLFQCLFSGQKRISPTHQVTLVVTHSDQDATRTSCSKHPAHTRAAESGTSRTNSHKSPAVQVSLTTVPIEPMLKDRLQRGSQKEPPRIKLLYLKWH